MATENVVKNEVGETSTNQDPYCISESCRILQDFAGMHINPEESISVDVDSNSETPEKYPNAPQTSPIDIQNDRDSSVFDAELLKVLSKLPMILLSSEERIKDGPPEISGFHIEDPTRSYSEASTSTDSEVRSDICKGFQDHYENIDGTCSKKTMIITASSYLAEDGKTEPTEIFSTDANNQMEKVNLLRVDSENKLNTDFHRSALSDKESMIANCVSDVSDISLEDTEYESSDDNSSCTSRERIEFEALAIDSAIHPTIVQRFQYCKIRGKTKRALSLDEVLPSKILYATDFSRTEFQLTI